MSEPTDWSLLARYLSDECSEEERNSVEAWMLSDPENQLLMEQMDIVWHTPEAEPQPSDVKKLWEQVAERAGMASRPGDVRPPAPPQPAPRTIQWPFALPWSPYRILRYAAILIFAIALPYFLWKMDDLRSWVQGTSEWNTITVEKGKRMALTLSDGTRITLDAASRLDYPEAFNGRTRDVFLHGEAYFEVTPNAEQPFVVHANHAIIRVLGTRFNVRAWQRDRGVHVTLVEGSVSLGSEKSPSREEVVLSKGQSSTLPENGPPSQPRPVDVQQHLAWMQSEWIFEDVPLDEVLHQLERWYDLDFALADSSMATERVTIHLQKQSIDDVLELIAALVDLRYERIDKSVHFKRKALK